MSDLNDWRLDYPGTSLLFGTLATDYPFSGQVEIGDPDRSVQDQDHPNSDGMVFGIDKLGGFTITFDGRIVPTFPPPAKPWVNTLDLFSTFQAKWRADSVRRVAGSYATLSNLDRGRMVYGRPRKLTKKLDRLRRGLLDFVATFDTVDPNFYDTVEKAALITPVPPAGGGFTTPLTPPFSTAVGSAELAPMVNEGDLPTWPIIQFFGPGKDFTFTLLNGVSVVWSVTLTGSLNFDQSVTIDTRPWARSATLLTGANKSPANGRIRGTALEKCTLPVGTFDAQFKVTDPSGTAFADIKWRDAYASL
jgi:hypothetical protein